MSPPVDDPGWTEEDWNRLSRRLYERRLELDLRYDTWKTFIEERANPTVARTLWDAEHAVERGRTNIGLGTLGLTIDPAYGWEPRSSEAILNKGEPVPSPGTPGAPRERARRARPVPETEEIDLSMFSPEEQRAIVIVAEMLDRKRQEKQERSA